jgi:hypothetical protein
MTIRDLVETAELPDDGIYHLHRRRHPTMKRLLTLFALPLVLVACDTQPVDVDTPDAQFAKGEKPSKPPRPTSGEFITFTGDLGGSQKVEGCCPNAGPFPEYTMTLSGIFPPEMAGEHTGNIFMNNWAPAPNRKDEGGYKVQFWWGEGTEDYYFLEINGGDVQYNKKTKFLTVSFDQEGMCIWHNGVECQTPVIVSFDLTRDPNG